MTTNKRVTTQTAWNATSSSILKNEERERGPRKFIDVALQRDAA
jgi:hypothetical protein